MEENKQVIEERTLEEVLLELRKSKKNELFLNKNKKMLAFIKSFIYNNHCVRESKTKNFWKPEEI